MSATAPRPQITEIDVSKLPPERIGDRIVLPKANRQEVPDFNLPSLLPEGPLTPGAGPTYDVGLKINPPRFRPPAIIPEDEPGTGGNVSALDNSRILEGAGKGLDTNQEPVPFDQFVNSRIVVKDTPDGGIV